MVDGGTDSLLYGDEAGMGTPVHDMTSICAVDQIDVPRKMLLSLGFGIDAFHGVCHAHVLGGLSALIRSGGYLGVFSLVVAMPEFAKFCSAIE